MDARLNLLASPVGAKSLKYIVSAGRAAEDSTLPAATLELVKLRASQINGCGFCTDMHFKDAVHAGETSTRLNLVAALVMGRRPRWRPITPSGHPMV